VDTKGYFIRRLEERIGSVASLRGRIEWDHDPPGNIVDVLIRIPKVDESGFDITVQLCGEWEINVIAADSVVDFFLSGKPNAELSNKRTADDAVEFIHGLLGPGYRVRQAYRGGLVYRGWVEERVGDQWKVVWSYGQVLWFRQFFAARTEKVFQNNSTAV
jgi:hypothetical protein